MVTPMVVKTPAQTRAAADHKPRTANDVHDVQAKVQSVQAMSKRLLDEVSRAIVGKKRVQQLLLINLLAQGNVLFEDYPGLAKTVMAATFAQASGCDFKRIQFTPDVLPADITGSSVFDQKTSKFEFRPGPLFTNFLLGDEINRAPPKTQSALLEAMQERQVTVDGTTHKMAKPYIVMATQNPVEQEGTYPLPEAQMDRFLMKLSMGYPNQAEEMEIARRRIGRGKDDFDVSRVTSADSIVQMQDVCEEIHVSDAVIEYISRIVVNTRTHPAVRVGSSPRGTLALVKAGRAMAALQGRTFVTPDDIRQISGPVLAHRIILKPDAQFGGTTGEDVIRDVVAKTPAPTT